MPDERYKYISANFSTAKQKGVRPAEAKRGRFFKNRKPADPNMTVSDRADRVLTHKIWSIPIFIVILFFVFHLTFSEDLFYINAIATAAGNPLPAMADLGHGATLGDSEIYSNFGIALAACFYDGAVFSPGVILTNLLNLVLNYIVYGIGLGVESAGAAEWAASLINDGIVGGITAVLASCRRYSRCFCSSPYSKIRAIWRAWRSFWTEFSAASAFRAGRLCL